MPEPSGPNALAAKCEHHIAELEAERLTASKVERRVINQRLHLLRDWLTWCKTRAGYSRST